MTFWGGAGGLCRARAHRAVYICCACLKSVSSVWTVLSVTPHASGEWRSPLAASPLLQPRACVSMIHLSLWNLLFCALITVSLCPFMCIFSCSWRRFRRCAERHFSLKMHLKSCVRWGPRGTPGSSPPLGERDTGQAEVFRGASDELSVSILQGLRHDHCERRPQPLNGLPARTGPPARHAVSQDPQ